MNSLLNCGLQESQAQNTWKRYIDPVGPAPLQKAHITSPWHFVLAQSNTPTPPHNLVERCHVAGLCVNLNKAHLRHGASMHSAQLLQKVSVQNCTKMCVKKRVLSSPITVHRSVVFMEKWWGKKEAQLFSLLLLVVDKDVKEKNRQVEFILLFKKRKL